MMRKNGENIEYRVPCQLYFKDGKLLELIGRTKNINFITTYFSIDYEENGCYYVTLLYPICYGSHFFLKPTDSKLFIVKTCVLGIEWVYDVNVVKDVIVLSQFHDCIESSFKIRSGFDEAIIWQSNLANNYSGSVYFKYIEGEEPFLEVRAVKHNQSTNYFLYKDASLTIDLTNVGSLTVKKLNMDTEVCGEFILNINTKLKHQL